MEYIGFLNSAAFGKFHVTQAPPADAGAKTIYSAFLRGNTPRRGSRTSGTNRALLVTTKYISCTLSGLGSIFYVSVFWVIMAWGIARGGPTIGRR